MARLDSLNMAGKEAFGVKADPLLPSLPPQCSKAYRTKTDLVES